MNDTGWVIVTIFAFLVGNLIGLMIDGAMWRADCNNLGAHLYGSQVYDCKPRAK